MNNKVVLTGNVGATPRVTVMPSGNTVVNITLATNEDYIDRQGQPQRKTTWHNVVAWNEVALKVSAHVNKGDFISLKGKLNNRTYESLIDVQVSPRKTIQVPVKRNITEVQAFEIIKL